MKHRNKISLLLLAAAGAALFDCYHAGQYEALRRPPSVAMKKTAKDAAAGQKWNTEEYAYIKENDFLTAAQNPLSTFSIDVDTASYSNVRRFLRRGEKPPIDAVRIEEMVNYFDYDYPLPDESRPFAIQTELSNSPWNKQNYLLHIGLKGKTVSLEKMPPANLVFLLDVSGSMNYYDKLPLLKTAIRMLSKQMTERDTISIVVYAGAAGVVLPPTRGHNTEKIEAALSGLTAGGSTAGGEGIELAYKIAQENYKKNGNNRIILATDGDFNVGVSSTSELTRLVEAKRKSGIYLTVLGFGSGNLKDSRMESLADKGNGNYAYIDSALEARKVLVEQMGGTLLTIAKDVKIQVEFNPRNVKEYRLIGYENRLLNTRDFDDDKKDAGEIGAGHTVTAIYEIVPGNNGTANAGFKYSTVTPKKGFENDLVTVKFRYKPPKKDAGSILLQKTVTATVIPLPATSNDFRFAAAVAGFGMQLRGSKHKGNFGYDDIIRLASEARGSDSRGYRAEFIELAKTAKEL